MEFRKLGTLVCVVATAGLVATGCSVGGGVEENSICAVSGNQIPKSDFDKQIDQTKRGYEQQKLPFPKEDSAEYKNLKNQVTDFLIQQELFEAQAEELGVKISDKDVDERLKQLKQNFFQGDEKKYDAELKKQGITEDEVKKNLRQQLISEKLFEKVTEKVEVSDERAQKYYDDNKLQYEQPQRRDVAHILVDAKAKALATRLYNQVRGGNQQLFERLAKQHSKDPSSKTQGGKLTVNKGQTVPAFDKVAFSLKTGQVAAPVKSPFGWHVIKALGEVQAKKTQSFDEVKEQIKSQLQQEERSKKMQDWITDLRKDSEDEVECAEGYVWTQTVKTTQATPDAPAPSTNEDTGGDTGDTGGDTGGETGSTDEDTATTETGSDTGTSTAGDTDQ